MSSDFFSVSSGDKKKNINVWIAYHATEKGVHTVFHFKKIYIQNFVGGNGDYFNVIEALLDSTLSILKWFEQKKNTVCLTIHCKNNHYYNIINEWRPLWKKADYKVKGEDRPFGSKLRMIDETGVEIAKVVHVVNVQEWNANVDKELSCSIQNE